MDDRLIADLDSNTPLWVGEVDLADPPARFVCGAADPEGRPYRGARILIRHRGEPLGMETVPAIDGEVDLDALIDDASRRYRTGTVDPLESPSSAGDAEPSLADVEESDVPAISVVIGTRNRPDLIGPCIDRILKQDYPSPVEIIVVDNGASDGSTAEAIASAYGRDERVRYMAEARPGLSRARNIGLAAARYPVTAFVSDDIRVDSLWLRAVARGFGRAPDVRCVTGICPPMFLDTREQLFFESSMAWGTRQGFDPVIYRFESEDDPVHPYRAGSYVNGSNMSYDTEVFRAMGGFDEALGPGTLARGGEDLDAPIRILAGGGLIAFEPSAIGWHADTYSDRSFERHMYTYGLGLTAFLAKHLIEAEHRPALLARVPKGAPMLLKAFGEPDEALHDAVPIPLKYHLWHLAGRVAGPVAYLRSRRGGRR